MHYLVNVTLNEVKGLMYLNVISLAEYFVWDVIRFFAVLRMTN